MPVASSLGKCRVLYGMFRVPYDLAHACASLVHQGMRAAKDALHSYMKGLV